MIKKILKISGIFILIVITVLTIYIYSSGPALPSDTDKIIDDVLKSKLPDIVTGKTGYARSDNLNIWYESISPKTSPKGTILLIMGISNDALGWPHGFISAFVDSGYRIIRYDHRGTGMSDWVENWDSKNPYSLKDMANDGIAVLNANNIDKAHIVGISMGGMIAQELVINHPDRVLSLTSMMSSCYIEDPELPRISSDIAKELIKVSIKYGLIKTERNMIKLHLASRMILMGNNKYGMDIKGISEHVLYNLRKRRGYNPDASAQHITATSLSGSRYDKLKSLNIPSLIIHGKSDPFIPIEHGKRCAELIPDADTLWIDGMGHDIPDIYIDILSKKIIINFNRKHII